MRQSADSTLLERLREAQRIGKEIRTFTEGLGQREIPETENGSHARPSSEVRFTSRCPLCKHPARDHKLGMRGETMHRNRISGPRYCHHTQCSGEFCQCSVPAEYFLRSGTQLLIRPDALAVGQSPKPPKLRTDVVIEIKAVELET